MPSRIAVVAKKPKKVSVEAVGLYKCPEPGCDFSTNNIKRLGKNEHPKVHAPAVECSICNVAIQPKKSNVTRHLHEQHGFFRNNSPFAGFGKYGRPGRAVKTDAWAAVLSCTTAETWRQSMVSAVRDGANPATASVYAAQTEVWREAVADRIAKVSPLPPRQSHAWGLLQNGGDPWVDGGALSDFGFYDADIDGPAAARGIDTNVNIDMTVGAGRPPTPHPAVVAQVHGAAVAAFESASTTAGINIAGRDGAMGPVFRDMVAFAGSLG